MSIMNTNHDVIITSTLILILILYGFVITSVLYVIKKRETLDKAKQEAILYYLIYYDHLTNLPNRLLFFKKIDDLLPSCKQNSKIMALICIDFNRFRLINDTLGHEVGDKFLKDISKKINCCLEEGIILARLGGDDFGILIPNVKNDMDVIQECNKVLDVINNEWVYNSRTFHITASMGVALYPKDGEDGLNLLKNADAAMYYAKERGKNNYEFYTPALSNRIINQVSMENSLMAAINKDEFILYYQPQVDISTGKIIGIEALIRWNNPDYGIVSPQKFIPFAEQNGLIFLIDKWVFRSACIQSRYLQQLNIEPIRVSVNISSKHFEDPNFVQYVKEILAETEASANWLEFEITESALMKQPEDAIKIINELKSMGIKIALDDFGTGYSSLGYLKKFSIDKLKIDQSFIKDLNKNLDSTIIVESIIDLCKNMGLIVIAEGVETKEQFDILKKEKCDQAQGYLFSKPVPLDEIEKMLTFRHEKFDL